MDCKCPLRARDEHLSTCKHWKPLWVRLTVKRNVPLVATKELTK